MCVCAYVYSLCTFDLHSHFVKCNALCDTVLTTTAFESCQFCLFVVCRHVEKEKQENDYPPPLPTPPNPKKERKLSFFLQENNSRNLISLCGWIMLMKNVPSWWMLTSLFSFTFIFQFCERNNGTRDSPEQCQICKLMKYLVFICLFFNLFKPKWIGVLIDNDADVHLQ